MYTVDPVDNNERTYKLKLTVRIDAENDDGEEFSETIEVRNVSYTTVGEVDLYSDKDEIVYQVNEEIDREVSRVFDNYINGWEVVDIEHD